MAVRQTSVASNGARKNLVRTLCGRGGGGEDLVQGGGTLCGAPCAGSLWALWGLGVCLSKKHNKTKRIHYFCHCHGSHAWNVDKVPVTRLKKCAPFSIRLRFFIKNGNSQVFWKNECIYIPPAPPPKPCKSLIP